MLPVEFPDFFGKFWARERTAGRDPQHIQGCRPQAQSGFEHRLIEAIGVADGATARTLASENVERRVQHLIDLRLDLVDAVNP